MYKLPIRGPGWLVIAAVAVPIIIKTSKPLAKMIADGLEKLAKGIEEAASGGETKKADEAKTTSDADAPQEPAKPKARQVSQAKPKGRAPARKTGAKTVTASKKPKAPAPK